MIQTANIGGCLLYIQEGQAARGASIAMTQDIGSDSRIVAALEYKLDEEGRLTLETKYFRGDSSVALEDEETWTVGLGVKL